MTANNFDRIANIYDRLAKLVFGNSIIDAQYFFLNEIQPNARILILGGGTGWIIKDVLSVRPEACVTYIEASAKMIAESKKKIHASTSVQFIQGTELDIPDRVFDVVITNFYLDLFNDEAIDDVITKIKNNLQREGRWIITDFVSNAWWQNIFLRVMYLFFKISCNISSDKLPAWNAALHRHGGNKIRSKLFYGDFIEAAVFQF